MEKVYVFLNQAGTVRRCCNLALAVLAIIPFYLLTPQLCPAAQIALAWDPNPEPTVSGYRVYYGTASYYYTAVIDAGNQTALTISGLVPGVTYFFSATAYSESTGDESYFSEEIAYTVPGGTSSASGSGGGGCFIATAAFDSYLAPEVLTLREFRDQYLLTSDYGRAVVEWYYQVSPPVAAVIGEHEWLKVAVRWGLTPLVYAVKHTAAALVLIVSVPFAVVMRRRRCGR